MKTIWVVIGSAVFGVALGLGGAVVEFGLPGTRADVDSLIAQGYSTRLPELAPPDAPQPKLRVDAQQFDFGRMDRSTTMSHDFVFTNEGDSPLTLVAGETTCKCAVSELANDIVAPGDSTTVTIEWTAKTDGDIFRQSANILTNDPRQRRVELTVSGKITDSVRVEPSSLVFSRLLAGSEQSAQVRVLSFLSDDFDIVGKKFVREELGDLFSVDQQELSSDELQASGALAGILLTVTAKPGLPLGNFEQELELATNLPDRTRLTIPIRGRVAGELSIIGPGWNRKRGMLSFGTVDRDKGALARLLIMVRGADGQTIEITTQRVTPAELQVTLGEPKPLKGGRIIQVPLTIAVPPGTPPMVHFDEQHGGLGEILLKTNHPRDKELRLKVRFAVGT
jgi:hypothetical protein